MTQTAAPPLLLAPPVPLTELRAEARQLEAWDETTVKQLRGRGA